MIALARWDLSFYIYHAILASEFFLFPTRKTKKARKRPSRRIAGSRRQPEKQGMKEAEEKVTMRITSDHQLPSLPLSNAP